MYISNSETTTKKSFLSSWYADRREDGKRQKFELKLENIEKEWNIHKGKKKPKANNF